MAAKDHWIQGGAVVLEMSDIPSTDDTELALPPPTRNVLLLDKRRQQALSKLQSVLKEQASHEELQEAMLTRAKFCTVFQRTDVLRLLFQLLDYNDDEKLVQANLMDLLNDYLKQAGSRAREFIDIFDVLGYIYAGDKDIDFDTFSRIFQAKGVTLKFFYTINSDYQLNNASVAKIMSGIATMTLMRRACDANAVDWDWANEHFRKMLRGNNEMTLEIFKKMVSCKNPFFAERAFQIIDKDKSGKVSIVEYREVIGQICSKSVEDKVGFLFQIYDQNGDGLIKFNELKEVLKACTEENGMKFTDEQLNQLTSALFDDAVISNGDTPDGNVEGIRYEQLKAQLIKHPGLLDNLCKSLEHFLLPEMPKLDQKSGSTFSRFKFSWTAIRNNISFISFVLLFLAVNVSLFATRAYQFRDSNIFYILARSSGQCLNFNSAFVVVLMLRRCITWLRVWGFADFIPLDSHVYLHKVVGGTVVFFSTIHTAMHCINFPLNVADDLISPNTEKKHNWWEWLFTTIPEYFGLIPGWANLTGWLLVIILIVLTICSLPFVRKRGLFEIFYWTHLLYIPFWIALIIHGPNFWKWFLGPGTLFIIEKIVRFHHRWAAHGKTYISSATVFPSRVTHLVIKKPPNFRYQPGDYVFIKIKSISRAEWHPFTISSAPELPDHIWLHIRGAGNWTNKLFDYFDKQQAAICVEKSIAEGKPACVRCSQILRDSDLAVGGVGRRLARSTIVSFNPIMNPNVAESLKAFRAYKMKTASTNQLNYLNTPISKGSRSQSRSSSIVNPDETHDTQFATPMRERTLTGVEVQNRRIMRPVARSNAASFVYLHNHLGAVSINTRVATEANRESQSLLKRRSKRSSIKAVATPRATFAPETIMETNEEAMLESDDDAVDDDEKQLEVDIDGPYGTPSSHIFHATHAVLIAAGIGVTPFASILQSIMNRYYASKQMCPRCDYCWNLKKVDFFWINREQRSFEWFIHLLSQLELEQAELGGAMERFLDLHMYITSALKKTDMKAVGLQMALDLIYANENRDLVTGLKTRTNAGRPNWDKVFQQLLDQNKGKVTVFYCGPPQLAKELKQKCDAFGFSFRKESF